MDQILTSAESRCPQCEIEISRTRKVDCGGNHGSYPAGSREAQGRISGPTNVAYGRTGIGKFRRSSDEMETLAKLRRGMNDVETDSIGTEFKVNDDLIKGIGAVCFQKKE